MLNQTGGATGVYYFGLSLYHGYHSMTVSLVVKDDGSTTYQLHDQLEGNIEFNTAAELNQYILHQFQKWSADGSGNFQGLYNKSNGEYDVQFQSQMRIIIPDEEES